MSCPAGPPSDDTSFNGKLHDGLLDWQVFYALGEAKVLIERWRLECSSFRPHSALGYRLPAPEAVPWTPPTGLQSADTVAPT
ncbi:MAG: transposase [bacterium]|nr:transposase [bacterium]